LATWPPTPCATRRLAARSIWCGKSTRAASSSWWKIPASASARNISRLTERFYRVDKSRSRETQGTGLGLAIVKHVLLRHGSTLQIKSEAGKGSTFIVCIPKTAIVARQPELALN
jgi:hypothetical protein